MAEHVPITTSRRALFGGALMLSATGLPRLAHAGRLPLTDWRQMEFWAAEEGNPAIQEIIAAAQASGWTPFMLAAVIRHHQGQDSWLALQALNHPRHADWPGILRDAQSAGLNVSDVDGVGAARRGARVGRLVVILRDGREVGAGGVW